MSGTTWTPAGDDLTRGWLWTYQKYDWMGRVVRKINTDGADSPTLNDSDVLISYDGCGCAGGLVTTIQSENVPRDDQPTVNARRTQKVYADILGRSWKTVIYKWDGTTAYTTTEQTFNGRDQVIKTKQIDNTSTASPQTFQEVTMTYDGHGRMKTRHYPIEDTSASTTWIYNADDSIQQIIDPRGAITNFTYGDPRGLTTQVSYSVPSGSTIPVTPTTAFAYDNLGNRTSMTTAGVNATTYAYDELSRITSETVDFDALANNLTIGYAYNLSGGLKSYTDPFNSTIEYTNDRTGRLTAVDGTAWAQNTTGDYASNIQYRAFGQIKRMDYVMPNGASQIKIEYDNRLRVSHNSTTQAGSTSNFLMKADFNYLADSRVASKDDLLDNAWDRTNKHDFAGRLVFNQFGMGTAGEGGQVRVYEQTVQYDGFSQLTSRNGLHWGEPVGFTETYANGRISLPGAVWDAAGNIISTGHYPTSPNDFTDTYFDASGRRTGNYTSERRNFGSQLNMIVQNKTEVSFDGDGRPVIEKRGNRFYHVNSPPSGSLTTSPNLYQVWSSVLKSSLTTVYPDGTKRETKVYAGGAVIANHGRHTADGQTYETTGWATADPVMGTTAAFSFASYGNTTGTEETEPFGQDVAKEDPYYNPPEPPMNGPGPMGGAGDMQWQCQVPPQFWGGFSGMPFHCQKQMLQDLSRGLDEIYGFSNPHNPNIPSRVTTIIGLDSPVLRPPIPGADTPAGNSGMNLALASMLNATSKPDDDDPESPKNRKKRRFEVEIRGSDEPRSLEIPDFKDASVQGGTVTAGPPLTILPDLCAIALPTVIPPGESVDSNITVTQNKVAELRRLAQANADQIRRSGDLGSRSAAAGAAAAADIPGGSIDRWFESMVADQKTWDYKWRTEDRRYEPFGNFNYGAVGAAAGYSLGQLQRMAGWVQTEEREGESPLTKLQARMGVGGTYPYGDQKIDALDIQLGFGYFNCRKTHPLR